MRHQARLITEFIAESQVRGNIEHPPGLDIAIAIDQIVAARAGGREDDAGIKIVGGSDTLIPDLKFLGGILIAETVGEIGREHSPIGHIVVIGQCSEIRIIQIGGQIVSQFISIIKLERSLIRHLHIIAAHGIAKRFGPSETALHRIGPLL